MQAFFNSLGSNYSNIFVLTSLKRLFLFDVKSKYFEQLQPYINSIAPGSITYTYKGRHAISLALKQLEIKKNDKVALQAFTCWAVEEAIHAVSAKPVFMDIAPDSLNSELAQLKQMHKTHPELKVVIVQHTLGYRANMKEILTYAKEHSIAVIEDLAHAADPSIESLNPDATILSFGRDKIIDGISGGALISNTSAPIEARSPIVFKDLLYPLLTWVIRRTYSLGFGKAFHLLLKKLGLLSSPIHNSAPDVAPLPAPLASLALISMRELPKSISHRRKISQIYQQRINAQLQLPVDLEQSTCLRFPLKVANRNQLILSLKKEQFYLADTWYRQPVEVGSLMVASSYKSGSCPQAEALSQFIFNLPTHTQMTPSLAQRLAKLINTHAQAVS